MVIINELNHNKYGIQMELQCFINKAAILPQISLPKLKRKHKCQFWQCWLSGIHCLRSCIDKVAAD